MKTNRLERAWSLALWVVGLGLMLAAAEVDTAGRAAALSGEFAARPPEPVKKHRGEIMQRIERLMGHQARFLVGQLKPWKEDHHAQLLTDGRSIEAGIRPNTHTLCGLAIMARYGIEPPGGPAPADARDRAIAILRFVLPTHGAGAKLCSDGKQWKNQWQSALWANDAGIGAWLLWDHLDDELKYLAARMIQDEADRFVGKTPPAQVERDTKAEENAWNSQVVALAYNMFPHHPRREIWRETAQQWQISSFATASDLQRQDLVDGRPIKDWVAGANLYDDYTLENHDRVHPDYMGTIATNLLQRLHYQWGQNPPPESLTWNTAQVYASLKKLCFADGGFVYANAQDWHLHRNADWLAVHATMASTAADPQAARLMRICLETAERMAARDDRGGIYAPGETNFPSSQAMLLWWPAKVYAVMASEGEGPEPIAEEELWNQLSGRPVFEYGKFALLRTPRSVTTFSWGRQVMGMVLPIQKDLLLAPCDRGLIGIVGVAGGKKDAPVAKKVRVAPDTDFLGVAGILDRGAGALEQRFGYAALADGRVIYLDLLRPTGTGNVLSAALGTIGVLNDRAWAYHDGTRKLYFAGGSHTFPAADARKDSEPVALSSPWYNLDDRLGIVCLASSGQQVYQVAPSGSAGRLEQLFHLNHVGPVTAEVQTTLIFYPHQTPAQTEAAAARCRLERNGDLLTVSLEDGQHITFDLQALTVVKN